MDGFQSQDLIHLIYTMCTGFYVAEMMNISLFNYCCSIGIAVMCISVDSHADIRRNRKSSWQMKQTKSQNPQMKPTQLVFRDLFKYFVFPYILSRVEKKIQEVSCCSLVYKWRAGETVMVTACYLCYIIAV